MGVMASGAVFNHSLAGPVRDAFAVGTTHPVFFLPEVALTAHLVAVIHIDFRALFGYQKITFIFFVTGITGQRPCLAAMIQDNFTMGNFSGPRDPDRFVIMALTATEALQLVLAGLGSEAPPLVSFRHQNGTYGKRQGRIDLLFIIKGSRCIFVGLNDAALCGIRRACWENQQQYRQNPPEAIFECWCLHFVP
jgi:hypothetical protein